jgi:alkylhydroperoxidase family enzyme
VARLRSVPRAEVTSEFVEGVYRHIFGDRDPVAEPGTDDGTRGDWWTVFANSPDVLEHAVGGFLLYQSPRRQLDPTLREIAQLRAGAAIHSRFVTRQHSLALTRLGAPPSLTDAVVAGDYGALGALEGAVCRYVDCLAHGRGVIDDGLFDEVHGALGDEATLELTYIAAMYVMHATVSVALRTEDDDVAAPGEPGER